MTELYEIKDGKLVWSGINAVSVDCAIAACDVAGQKSIQAWRKGTMVYLPSQTNIHAWQQIWDFANGVN